MINKLADFYHVMTDYLLGRETKEETALDSLSYEFDMTLLEKEIVENYLSLPKDQRENAMDFIIKTVDETHAETVRRNADAAPVCHPDETIAPKTLGEDLADELSRLVSKTPAGKLSSPLPQGG